MPEQIAILGSGNMGRSLGVRLAATGYPVFFGARRPEQAESAASLAKKAASSAANTTNSATIQHGSINEAALQGDILIWTIRERDARKVITTDNLARTLAGKAVVDINNRDYATEVAGEGDGTRWFDVSLGEQLQQSLDDVANTAGSAEAAGGAVVVKAFNTVAMEALDISPEKLQQSGGQIFTASMRDDDIAKTAREKVKKMIEALGWRVVDLGAGRAAMRGAEAMGDVIRWAIINLGMGGRANVKIDLLPEADLGHIGERKESAYH